MAKTSKYMKRAAKELFRSCHAGGLIDPGRVHQIVTSVLRKNRRNCVALLGHFRKLVRIYQSQHMAEVDSAVPLPAEVQAHVHAGLEQVYGPGITTSFVQQPDLIGGMRIKIGSDVYDGSIKAKLAALEQRF